MDGDAACEPKLPMELFYRVIECLDRKRDYTTLRGCSTVCRAFLPQCQRVLFHSIDLSSDNTLVHRFLSLLKHKPGLAALIRRFQYLVAKNVNDEDASAISELVLPNVETLIINGWMTYTLPISEPGHRALAHVLCWPSIRAVEIQGFKRFSLHLLRLPTRISMLYISPVGLSDSEYLVDVDSSSHASSSATEVGTRHQAIELQHLIIDKSVSSALLQKLSNAALPYIDISTLTILQLALKPVGREAQSWPSLILALCNFLQFLTSLKTLQITFPLYYNQPKLDLSRILSPLLRTLTTLSIHWSGAQVNEEWFLGYLTDTFVTIQQDNRLERVELALEFTKIPIVPPALNESSSTWTSFANAMTKTARTSSCLQDLIVHVSLCELRGISKRMWQDRYTQGPRRDISRVAKQGGFYLDFRIFWVQLQSGALRQSIIPINSSSMR